MIPDGTAIGSRYSVVSYIASGGMQDVYKAHDRLTDIHVALKTPQVGQVGKRFAQSAQLSSRVNHYSVAKTTDYFVVSGVPYLIEELVEGVTLEAATLERLFYVDPHLGAHIMLRLAKGTAASHNAGVAHRDLKPGNVLVGSSESFSDLKITDFGIATLADELFDEVVRNGGDLTRSTSGTIQGALPYMAPEMMFRRPGQPVGPEADVWALGAMMFRLLTGEYPFGQAMMVPVNVTNDSRAPWPVFMTSNPQYSILAQALQDLIETCLRKEKTSRPTAAELVLSLENMCFFFAGRQFGEITSRDGLRYKLWSDAGHVVFFHGNSFYGTSVPNVGDRVSYAAHPGSPWARGHPVIPARKT